MERRCFGKSIENKLGSFEIRWVSSYEVLKWQYLIIANRTMGLFYEG